MKYDTRTGDIARENVVSAAREYLPGIIHRFNPKNAKFSTFVNANMAPKQQVVYEEAKDLSYEMISLDAPQVREMAIETTELENTLEDTKKSKIDILKIGKIANKEQDIIKVVKVKKGDTFREVIDKNEANIGSEIFGIPGNKVADPKANLATSDNIVDVKTGEVIPPKELKEGRTGILEPSESKSIQDVFANVDTATKFIKTLPPTNVSSKDADINKIGENIEVSRDVLGRAIGLPNRILEYFYKPVFKSDGKRARSQGKTSQVGLWELKNEFKNPKPKAITQFQIDLGITEKKEINELPTKEQRSTIGQLLKGAARTLAQQASLSAAQRKLTQRKVSAEQKKAIKQQTADITAAQSKISFSKATVSKAQSIIDNPNFAVEGAVGKNKLDGLLLLELMKKLILIYTYRI